MNRVVDGRLIIIGLIVLATTSCAWRENAGLGVLLLLTWVVLLALGSRQYIGSMLIGIADGYPLGSSTASSLYQTAAALVKAAVPRKPHPRGLHWAGLLASAWASSGVESVEGEPTDDRIRRLLEPYAEMTQPSDPDSQLVLFRLAEASYHLGEYAEASAIATRAPLRSHNLNQGYLPQLVWVKAMASLAMGRRAEAESEAARLYASCPSFWGVASLRAALSESASGE